MMNRNKIAAALSALFVFAPIHSHATSLLQAYQAALANDPTFRGAKADRVAGKEYETIGRAGLLPSAQYSYTTSKNKGETVGPSGLLGLLQRNDQDYSSSSKAVSVRQVIYNADAYARFKQGVAQGQFSEAQFDARSADLIVRLVSAFADANYALDQIKLYTAQRDALKEQRNVNDRLYAKGEGTKTDMLETQAKLDVAETMILEANDGLQAARAVLNSIVGMELNQIDRLVDNFKPTQLQGSFEDWKQTAIANNPEIQAGRHNIEIAEQEIAKARAGHLPRVDLNASYNHGVSETVATRNQDNNIRSIGVQLIIPIYSGGYTNAALKQAIAHRDKAKADFDAAIDKLGIELKKQYNSSKSSIVRIEAMERTVKSAELLVEATKQSIKGGVRINADLLNAEQQLMTARRDLASARYNYLLSFMKLRVAAGTISYDDVKLISAYFTPEA